ncbi:MAG TPA: AAA family ATPase [Candidatus Udaeobacter sp.]|nr:AAA family ATPase [Candidatus Udaeobacter sp.]
MIEAYWGLLRPPFTLDPDARFLFESSAHREGLARLLFAVRELKGTMTLLTGEIGCGKTTLGRALERLLPPHRFHLAYVSHPALPVPQLLALIARGFGVQTPPETRGEPVSALQEQLIQLADRRVSGVLVVDEAQLLQQPQLEQLRLLTNLESATAKLLHIVLIGQPELVQNVARYPELAQRIAMRFHLRPLTFDETGRYVRHRLRVAGAGRPIFTESALAEIYRHTGGVPRLVNVLSAHALFLAATFRRSQVEAAAVAAAAHELELAMTRGRGQAPPPLPPLPEAPAGGLAASH